LSLAIRIDCYSLNSDKPLHVFKEITADSKSCIIDNLSEKTNYRINVTAITEEYFINHKIKELKQLPKLILESMPWLPTAQIDAMTSGTDPPANLEWKLKHNRSVALNWMPAIVYGTNKLINQVIFYQELSSTASTVAAQVPVTSDSSSYKFTDLKVGSKYKMWVEAVVLIKTNIESDMQNVAKKLAEHTIDKSIGLDLDYYKELSDSRLVNVKSETMILRVPAPCEPAVVNLTSYTNETIDLYWSKPNLHSQHKDPNNPERKYNLYRHLLGYRLEVNNIRQRELSSNENICTLTKCKPSYTYSIVVISRTCLSTSFEVSKIEFVHF
jgi:hypothetical protein